MITIQVYGDNGKPLANADVHVSWGGLTSSSGRTDSSGRVSLNSSPGTGTVRVNGREVYKGRIEGSLQVSAR